MTTALQLFRKGFDYIEIAAALHSTEAAVEREIHRLRAEEARSEAKRAAARQYYARKKEQYRVEASA